MKLKFSRNSWHRKLQHYTLKLGPHSWDDFPNLCPYFWITVVCLFIVPFVFLYRSFMSGARWVGAILTVAMNGIGWVIEKAVFNPLDYLVFNPLYEDRARRMDGVDVYRSFRRGDKTFAKWQALHPDEWSKLIAKYKLEWIKWKDEQTAEKQRKYDAQQARVQNRRKLALRAAAIMQKIFPVLGALLILVIILAGSLLGYLLFLLGKWTVRVVPWILVFKFTVGILLCIAGLLAIGVPLFLIIEKLRTRDACAPVIRRAPRGPNPIGRFCRWFFGGIAEGIVTVIEFFVQYLKASKENYCPAIEWED